MSTYITTSEAAQIIGCLDRQVRKLIAGGVLRGQRIGRDWLVERASAESYARTARKPGRKPAAK